MPLFYQHNINDFTKLGIWKIDEEEKHFFSHIPLSREITHPHKRLQHLAARYLLPYLFPDFPLSEILIASTRKPFLENEAYHFSISHCGDYAAAIASSVNRAGVDIELVSDKVKKIEAKFLSEEEMEIVQQSPYTGLSLLTVLWSAKESIYKWYGNGGIDFKEHMQLKAIEKDLASGQFSLDFLFTRDTSLPLKVHGIVFDEIVLTWVAT